MHERVNPDFWAVAAQVVPVLALALVIEVRAFARQMTRKNRFQGSLIERITFVVMAMIIALLLATAFSISLSALSGLTRQPVSDGLAGFVVYSLALATGFVALAPLLSVVRRLVGDVRPRFALWRGERRLAASRSQLQQTVKHGHQITLEGSLRARTELAREYVTSMRILREVGTDTRPSAREARRIVESHLTELDDYRHDLDAFVLQRRAELRGAEELLTKSSEIVTPEEFDSFRKALKELAI